MKTSLKGHESWYDWARLTLNHMWAFRPGIEEALRYANGTHTFDDVCYMVFQGQFAWFVSDSDKSLVLTEIQTFPRKTVVHGFLVCGELDDLTKLIKEVMDYYTAKGYKHATMNGRPGWRKVMEQLGWKSANAVFSYDVPQETIDLFNFEQQRNLNGGHDGRKAV